MNDVPKTDATMRAILGLLITIGFFGVVLFVLLYPVQSSVRDIVLVLLGALIASFKEVTGFFFGSSSNAVTANQTIASSMPQQVQNESGTKPPVGP